MNVVLVHGWLNTGWIMGGLRQHLVKHGHACFVPSLSPIDARSGIAPLAVQLARYIDNELPADASFAIVGFSMGALVSRFYLQELGGHLRAQAFFSICGPHAGTVAGYLYPGLGARDMRPGSSLITDLNRSHAVLMNIPIACYWTPFDLMIRPVKSARLSHGEAIRIPALFHALMPFDRRLLADIVERLNRLRVG